MKTLSVFLFVAMVFFACSNKSETSVSGNEPPTTYVTLTHVGYGKIRSEISLMATTAYLRHTAVMAPISAFLTQVLVQPGMRVHRGQLLFEIESKEYQALKGSDAGTLPHLGHIQIRAAEAGIIVDVTQQSGSYAPEGTTLATEVDPRSMVFKIDVPYEQSRYARPGSSCSILLPDQTRLHAILERPLVTMDVEAQSQQVIARAKSPFLPEGMNVKALLSKDIDQRPSQILPKSAVMSNEDMSSFWIMALQGNRAKKIIVKVGNSNSTNIEILSPLIPLSSSIILTGGYALTDGAHVIVKK